jgi:hypothetical protein
MYCTTILLLAYRVLHHYSITVPTRVLYEYYKIEQYYEYSTSTVLGFVVATRTIQVQKQDTRPRSTSSRHGPSTRIACQGTVKVETLTSLAPMHGSFKLGESKLQ